MADALQSSDELLTADIGPARWGASEKVSPAAAVVGLGQPGGSSLCHVCHPTGVGGFISRLTFLARATTSPLIASSWMETAAPHQDRTRSRRC